MYKQNIMNMSDSVENKEVTWKVLNIPVYGTITAPADNETRSAIILVAGSGPTDRNWCSTILPGTNGSAKLLAEALATQGFVTIRYDKVASGPHVKENLERFSGKISMQTHMDELKGAVETLISERKVKQDSLIALTNSEGAIHAVNYQLQAKQNRFKGMVLTGAPGRAIGEVSRTQIYSQAKSFPSSEVLMRHYDEAISDFTAGRPIVIDPSLPDAFKLFLHSLENPSNLPFSRELWKYDLPEYVSKIMEPLMVVIGKKDIQIDWKVDGKELEKATSKNNRASFVYPENANHVLKHEELPLEKLTPQYVSSHYNAPGTRLDEEAESAICRWLIAQSQTL